MIASLMKYLGCSYHEILHVIPWQVIQGVIAVVQPYDNKATTTKKNSDNDVIDFFAFGTKFSNLAP